MITIKMINKGMITIPSSLRKKFNFSNGSEFFVDYEENGIIHLIPVVDVEIEHDWYVSPEEMIRSIREERERDIKTEDLYSDKL